eukprot:tig00000402_g246.t1
MWIWTHVYAQVEAKRLNLDPSIPLAVRQWDGLIAVNYAARAKGVARFCSIEQAKELCPDIVLVHVETIGNNPGGGEGGETSRLSQKACLERYRRASQEIFDVFARNLSSHTPIEKASIDEAYMDVSAEVDEALLNLGAHGWAHRTPEEIEALLPAPHGAAAAAGPPAGADGAWAGANVVVYGAAGVLDQEDNGGRRLLVGAAIALRLRRAVFAATRFTCSAGVAHGKAIAKLGSGMNKPNKQTVVPAPAVPELMGRTPLTKIRFLGGKLGQLVKERFPQVEMAGDLVAVGEDELAAAVGEKQAAWLYRIVRGVDDSDVIPRTRPKSMLAAKSFNEEYSLAGVTKWLHILARELVQRMRLDFVTWRRRPRTLNLIWRGMRGLRTESLAGLVPSGLRCHARELLGGPAPARPAPEHDAEAEGEAEAPGGEEAGGTALLQHEADVRHDCDAIVKAALILWRRAARYPVTLLSIQCVGFEEVDVRQREIGAFFPAPAPSSAPVPGPAAPAPALSSSSAAPTTPALPLRPAPAGIAQFFRPSTSPSPIPPPSDLGPSAAAAQPPPAPAPPPAPPAPSGLHKFFRPAPPSPPPASRAEDCVIEVDSSQEEERTAAPPAPCPQCGARLPPDPRALQEHADFHLAERLARAEQQAAAAALPAPAPKRAKRAEAPAGIATFFSRK